LASGARDGSVLFWDGRDGGPSGILEHSFFYDSLTAVAFSSSLLAAATTQAITLFNRETLCLVYTLKSPSESLSFSQDGSLLASAHDIHIPDDCSARGSWAYGVTVYAVGQHTPIATFHLDEPAVGGVIISPNGSRLAALLDGDFKFFDVDKKCPIQRPSHEDLNWLPNLSGVLLSRRDNCLLGRFIDRSDPFPVLWVPGDVDVTEIAVGSSAFAMGTRHGIIIGRVPTSSIH